MARNRFKEQVIGSFDIYIYDRIVLQDHFLSKLDEIIP